MPLISDWLPLAGVEPEKVASAWSIVFWPERHAASCWEGSRSSRA